MRYPTIAQYVETLSNPLGLFRTLRQVAPSRDRAGDLRFSSGAFGVVFRAEVDGKPYALKCFTRHQAGRIFAYERIVRWLDTQQSAHLAGCRLLNEEIAVFAPDGSCSYFPVLLMEWVEGESLSAAIESAVRRQDRTTLRQLADGFDRLARWMLEQPFAHGDLKPDNLLVRSDGTLALIDYDGLYLPEMAGEQAREGGTEGFRHPARTAAHFGKQIDDYPIALLSLTLRLLADEPGLYTRFHRQGNLLFTPSLLLSGECPAYNHLRHTSHASNPLFAAICSPHETLPNLSGLLGGTAAPAQPAVDPPESPFDFTGEPSEGMRPFRQNGKYGFCDASDHEAVPPRYDRAHHFSEGAAAVSIGGRWGFIDPAGRELTPMQFDDCSSFSEGRVAVCTGGRWGYLDRSFRWIAPARFLLALPFRQGRAVVRRERGYGFLAPTGRVVIPMRFEHAQSFHEGAACVVSGGKYGYIDRQGRWIVPPTYDYARSKHNGLAWVETQGEGVCLSLP